MQFNIFLPRRKVHSTCKDVYVVGTWHNVLDTFQWHKNIISGHNFMADIIFYYICLSYGLVYIFLTWHIVESFFKARRKTTNTNREHLLSCSISYVIILFFKLLILVSMQTFIRSKLFRWDMARWKNDFEHDLKNLIRLLTGFSVTISQYISDENAGPTQPFH